MPSPNPDDPRLRSASELLKASRSPLISHLHTSGDQVTRRAPRNPIRDFIGGIGALSLWIFHYLKSRFGRRYQPRPYPVGSNTGVYPLFADEEPIRIGIAADWATYTDESNRVMQQLRAKDPHYTIHLGDIYYTGTPDEVRENFTGKDPCWHYGSVGSYALPGNHEMYCNGKGFFVTLLQLLRKRYPDSDKVQASSYFCLENKYWRIIGLDTGQHSISTPGIEYLFPPSTYLDHHAEAWLRDIVKIQNPDDKRGLLILSHHQVISAFDKIFTKPAEQLKTAMGAALRPVVWLWGHEHRMAVYSLRTATDKSVPAWGRCIGHGGMPVELHDDRKAGIVSSGLLYYDARKYTTIKRLIGSTEIGYNGYINMIMTGPKITLKYRDINDSLTMEESFTIDLKTSVLGHQITNYLLKNLEI